MENYSAKSLLTSFKNKRVIPFHRIPWWRHQCGCNTQLKVKNKGGYGDTKININANKTLQNKIAELQNKLNIAKIKNNFLNKSKCVSKRK